MRGKRSFSPISVSSGSEGAKASSDDDANADFSMGIVAKASSRKTQGQSLLDAIQLESEEEILKSNGKGFDANSENGAAVIAEETSGTAILPVATTTKVDRIERPQKDGKKKRKKKEKEVTNVNVGHHGKEEGDPLVKVIADDGEDNLAMRKLLRGARYFDLPEEKTCFWCGNVGHIAADCTKETWKKACYVCGSFDHEAKDCPQGSCFICKGIGHYARSCPNKADRVYKDREGIEICLRCGDVGHQMSICDRDYSPEDLKVIQCYVCKKYSHLCYVDIVRSLQTQVSCYNCGEIGHTGVGCAKRRTDIEGDKQPAKVCYRCGEEGHYARGCSRHDEVDHWGDPRTPDSKKPQAEDGFLGFKSVPAAVGARPRWLDMQHEERSAQTSSKRRWPERWNMEIETDSWGNFQAHRGRNGPVTSVGRKFQDQEKDTSSMINHRFPQDLEFETPGSGSRSFKRQHKRSRKHKS